MAVGLRHLAFHRRTRAAMPGSVTAAAMSRRIGTGWAAVESNGACELAERVLAVCGGGGDLS